jgi:hypothetical protein
MDFALPPVLPHIYGHCGIAHFDRGLREPNGSPTVPFSLFPEDPQPSGFCHFSQVSAGDDRPESKDE